MFRSRPHAWIGFASLVAACGLSNSAQAQYFGGFGGYNACNTCAQPVAMAPVIQSASVCDCPCMKPVTETVFQDVQTVEMRPEQRVVKVAKTVTVMEDREVTTYQTVNETRVADVTSYVNQSYTECQPVTYNQSYWRTQYQPVAKCSPCQYDNRPGMMGEFNRLGLAFRNSLTPNYVARREFVPNIVSAQVPVQRTVQIPTTQQVTYNVAKVVPTVTTQKVPVQRVVYEDQTVTAMVPFTTTKRVAVGTRTRMAYVDPFNGSTTASASAEPTPANPSRSADNKGTIRPNSTPSSEPAPLQLPTHRREFHAAPETAPQPTEKPVATSPEDEAGQIVVAGWRPSRRPAAAPTAIGPELSIVQK